MGKILILFSNLGPVAVWFLFFFFFAVVLSTSILIPRFLVTFFKTSRLKMAFFGVFFVAIITSAPELISMIMLGLESRSVSGASGDHLTQGWANIFGANICTFFFLALFHILIIFKKKGTFRRSGSGTMFSLITLLIFDIFYLLTFVPAFSLWGANITSNVAITPMTILLFVGYAFFLLFSFRFERKNAIINGGGNKIKIETKTFPKNRMNSFFVFSICFLMGSALVLSMLGTIPLVQKIKENHNISDVAIGGLFLTFITSSPEIWSTISFFWMGYLSAAVGVVLGSQIFNLLLIQVLQVASGENIVIFFDESKKTSETLGVLLIAFGINISASIYYFLYKNSVRRIVSALWIPVLFLVFLFFSNSF